MLPSAIGSGGAVTVSDKHKISLFEKTDHLVPFCIRRRAVRSPFLRSSRH